mmetsp:Transcript_2796/g.6711  ORF Transcript_2796/g.6711 Transcript_2796/m.6711 type:complete len:278 (+) Transcript_2796:167-1000(+)
MHGYELCSIRGDWARSLAFATMESKYSSHAIPYSLTRLLISIWAASSWWWQGVSVHTSRFRIKNWLLDRVSFASLGLANVPQLLVSPRARSPSTMNPIPWSMCRYGHAFKSQSPPPTAIVLAVQYCTRSSSPVQGYTSISRSKFCCCELVGDVYRRFFSLHRNASLHPYHLLPILHGVPVKLPKTSPRSVSTPIMLYCDARMVAKSVVSDPPSRTELYRSQKLWLDIFRGIKPLNASMMLGVKTLGSKSSPSAPSIKNGYSSEFWKDHPSNLTKRSS